MSSLAKNLSKALNPAAKNPNKNVQKSPLLAPLPSAPIGDSLPFGIQRTSSSRLPVYRVYKNHNQRILTEIRKIQGDIHVSFVVILDLMVIICLTKKIVIK
jgi:hypothetical protein